VSIVFPMALFASVACTATALFLARRRISRKPRFGCLLAILASPYIFGALFYGWLTFFVWLGDSKGADLSYEEAKGRMGISLPTSASQIDFSKHYHHSCSVDFSIDEQGFLDWCESENWIANPIVEEVVVDPVRPSSDGERPEILITKGYSAITVPIDGDFGGTVTYDKESQRAFYRFHSF